MDAQVIQLAPFPIAMIRHKGPYDQIGPKFDQLWGWIGQNNVPAIRTLGLYWDNTDYTPAAQLRSAACVEVPAGFQMPAGSEPVELGQVAGGAYATTKCVGPYENLAAAWTELTKQIEGPMGRKISENPAFEVYVNDPSDTAPDQLITELYMPVL
ncbi:MAG: GyrI-like domain-containing protein [Armatimonadetes bacterium]|nr:GyrI-like domain-containing protein [Armatimonadota bacterium]